MNNRLLRVAAGLLFAIALTLVTGCGGSKSGKGHGSVGETVYVEGKVSVRGNMPFELLLLEGSDGTVYMVDTSPTAEELKQLDEMNVGVTAKVLPEVKGDALALSVVSYEILPLPTGERPIVGVVVAASPDAVTLKTDDGNVWKIEGEFTSVFHDLVGAKMWIVGEKREASPSAQNESRSINVTQYGIIRKPH